MKTFEQITTFEVVCCASCGMHYGLPKDVVYNLRSTGNTFYCPSGHSQVFSHRTEDILRSQLNSEKERANAAETYLRWEKLMLARRDEELRIQKFKTMGERSAKNRIKKRVGNGSCPCCKRSFSNLQRHMVHMHPEFKNAE